MSERLGLAAWVAACLGAGVLGAMFTRAGLQDWYPRLRKPDWNPPAWVFAPVWTLLYLSMALSAWMVWRGRGFSGAPWSLGLFVLQLALNTLWSALFFSLRSPRLAAIEIVLLWSAIVATLIAFLPTGRLAAVLLAPYLAWVTFAAMLNFAIWRMNRPARRTLNAG